MGALNPQHHSKREPRSRMANPCQVCEGQYSQTLRSTTPRRYPRSLLGAPTRKVERTRSNQNPLAVDHNTWSPPVMLSPTRAVRSPPATASIGVVHLPFERMAPGIHQQHHCPGVKRGRVSALRAKPHQSTATAHEATPEKATPDTTSTRSLLRTSSGHDNVSPSSDEPIDFIPSDGAASRAMHAIEEI